MFGKAKTKPVTTTARISRYFQSGYLFILNFHRKGAKYAKRSLLKAVNQRRKKQSLIISKCIFSLRSSRLCGARSYLEMLLGRLDRAFGKHGLNRLALYFNLH